MAVCFLSVSRAATNSSQLRRRGIGHAVNKNFSSLVRYAHRPRLPNRPSLARLSGYLPIRHEFGRRENARRMIHELSRVSTIIRERLTIFPFYEGSACAGYLG